jgi:hypothetical protein
MIELEKEQKGREGFLMISQQFLKEEVRKIGPGPAMLYLQLLSYCYGEKEIAYPSLKTLAHSMGVTVKTIVFYRKVLVSSGLIKKIIRRKQEHGNYQNTIYQLVRFSFSLKEEYIDETEPVVSEVVTEREENSSKDKRGELSSASLAEELRELGIPSATTDFLLKHYSQQKIRGKLPLLREKGHLDSPGGYLLTVLRNSEKNDNYQQEEELSSAELEVLLKEERIAQERYYQKLKERAIPPEESLKYIRKIIEQLKEGKMDYNSG